MPHQCLMPPLVPCASRRAGWKSVRPAPPFSSRTTSRRNPDSANSQVITLNSAYFPRPWENEQLEETLLSTPTEVLLLLGPRACGKTALLRHTLRNLQSASLIWPSYLDCNQYDMTDPVALARSLATNLTANYLFQPTDVSAGGGLSDHTLAHPLHSNPLLRRVAQSACTDSALRPVDQGISPTHGSDPTLGEVLGAYTELLERPLPGFRRPVIVLDGCEALKRWPAEQGPQLNALLHFLARLCCQERSARVVLASHDGTMMDWLGQRLGYGSFRTEVVGDFSRDEVPAFLRHLRPDLSSSGELSPRRLRRVTEVCGGNAGALVRWAAAYKGDMDAALHNVSKDVGTQLREALSFPPLDGPSWTREQFTSVMQVLLETGGLGAVPREDLLQQLGRASGAAALAALLERQLLAVRPAHSAWARDLPAGAWRGGWAGQADHRLITAASPVHLYKMRIWAGGLVCELEDRAQDTFVPEPPVRSVSAQRNRAAAISASPASATDASAGASSNYSSDSDVCDEEVFREVYDDIWAVESALQDVEHSVLLLQRDKPPGWKREMEQQLQAREQLREERRELQDKARTLARQASLYL